MASFRYNQTKRMMDQNPTVYCLGQNRFGQFKKCIKQEGLFDKINWTEFGIVHQNIINFHINVTVNYSAIAVDFKLFVSTIDLQEELLTSEKSFVTKPFTFNNLITKICSNTSYCLVLLENGDIFQIMIRNFETRMIKCVNIETMPVKKSMFVQNETATLRNVEKIIDIACGETVCIGVTNFNAIYNIPNLTYIFERHVKIKKICCGNEHSMVLTGNGDVYTFGTGLRGQLGHMEIKNEEVPKLVDGLAGIKIIDISAGGWSSAAVSAFGDLYVWGWNSCGQLGLRVFESSASSTSVSLRHKLQTVYTAPTLVSIEQNNDETDISINRVFCGSKHTVVQTDDGRVFVTGSNTYNQLGFTHKSTVYHTDDTKHENFIDHFEELIPKVEKEHNHLSIYCAYSCTLFIENK